MTNEEKIQQLFNEPCWESKPYLIGMDKVGVEDVMERFAEWKDEQHEQEKQQWIDRAADFISKKFYIGINNHITSNENYYSLTELIRDFEQAVKGE